MMRLYQLDISQEYEPFESSADDCAERKYGSVIIETSPLSCDHSPYHAERTAIKESVDDSGAHMSPIVAWTGHLLPNNPGHVTFTNDDSTAGFVVMTMYASVDSSYIQNSDAEVKAESEFALCHELSHCLSLDDHYCLYDNDPITGKCSNEDCDICYLGATKQRDCIMTHRGPYVDPTIDGFCLDCYNRIRDFLSENE